MPDYQTITFDCYGTLIDWESGIVAAFRREAALDGLRLDPGEIIQAYMAEEPAVEAGAFLSYREVLAETALRVGSRLGWNIGSERATFLAESIPLWQPFPDTNPALRRLARRFKLGILSNIDDDLLAETRRRHLDGTFDPIITAQQVRSYKPGHAHFSTALSQASPGKLLHAAQSYYHDVVPACQLDIPVVWVNRKGEKTPEGGPQPNHEVRDLAQLADLVQA